MSLPSLDGNDLYQASYTGFNYPQNATVVPILGDGTTPGGNAVLQQGALTLRQATVTWLAVSPAEVAIHRALYESKEVVAYVDHDGGSRNVRVLDFSASVRVGDYWDCSATLLEAV